MTSTDSAAALVPFMMRRPGVSFPPPEYEEFRTKPGLVKAALPSGETVWLVTRHEEVRAVLTDPRISSNPTHEGFPRPSRTVGAPSADDVPGWFVSLDPPDHNRFRKALIPEFTVRRIRSLRPAVEEIVDRAIDQMLGGGNTAELVEDFSLTVPSLVISSLLGVPKVDRDFFEEKTKVLVTLTSTDEQRDKASEHLLRYHSVADLVALRVAIEDVEIGGQLVRAGEGIVPLVAGANHDPEMFDRPHEFDPSRSATGHVAFGYGVHQCLGQNLVRLEMDVAYRGLFQRIPTLEVAVPLEELQFKYDGVLFGLHALPVRW